MAEPTKLTSVETPATYFDAASYEFSKQLERACEQTKKDIAEMDAAVERAIEEKLAHAALERRQAKRGRLKRLLISIWNKLRNA